MSPRAAWRLEHLGLTDVRDYVGGKMDWLGHGLGYDGDADLVSRHLVEAPTCVVSERVGDVRRRLADRSEDCLVVDAGVVVGELDLHADAVLRAEEAMTFGITTVRPSEERHELSHRLADANVDRAVVTDPAGRLLGIFRRP